jgi:bifunctional non-homologous end joining protein LigD
MPRGAGEIEVEGRRLKLSNLDKVMYPAAGFTKGDLIDYYVRISSAILPHLRGRPLTLKRYPDGVRGDFFYEKNCPGHRPGWVRTVRVRSRRGSTPTVDYCLADDLATLVWLANLAAVELHPLLALSDALDRPTAVVFDLDPGEPAGILECAQVACWLRDGLDGLGLRCFPKSSGSKGLQVYLPVDASSTYNRTRPFAEAVAQLLVRHHPDLVVANMRKSLRRGKVLVDWSQNSSSKTTVCAYSLRALEQPTASTPLTWEEVESALSSDDPGLLSFGAADLVRRVEEAGDLFAPVLELEQPLPEL